MDINPNTFPRYHNYRRIKGTIVCVTFKAEVKTAVATIRRQFLCASTVNVPIYSRNRFLSLILVAMFRKIRHFTSCAFAVEKHFIYLITVVSFRKNKNRWS